MLLLFHLDRKKKHLTEDLTDRLSFVLVAVFKYIHVRIMNIVSRIYNNWFLFEHVNICVWNNIEDKEFLETEYKNQPITSAEKRLDIH